MNLFVIVPVVIVVLYILNSIKILAEYERGVIFRVGRALRYPTVESCSPALAGAVTDRIWACVSVQWDWLGGAKPATQSPAEKPPERAISRAA